MKNIQRPVLILLGISFILRLSIGLITGAADDDAGDYVTYAIQTSQDNDFRNFIDFNSGRQVIQLWLFCIVCFMKLFGATNTVAILFTSIIGTFNIIIFFKLVNLFYTYKKSFYISIIYSIMPIIVYTSYNPCYETFFIFIFLIAVYYFFRYINSEDNRYLVLSGSVGSLLAFIHAYGYPVILVIILSFLLIYSGKDRIKKWIIFSFFLLFLPLLQMIAWKIIYNSFYPYMDLLKYWVSDNWAASISEIIRFVFYCLFSLSFILLPGILLFIFDLKGALNKITGLILLAILLGLFLIFSFREQNDLFKYFFLIFSILFLVLKRPLIRENSLVYLFGVLALVFFTLMIYRFPARGNPRMFAFIITMLIPVTWYYLETIIKRTKIIFLIYSSVILILLTTGLIVNFTSLKDKEIGFVKGKYSSVFQYNIPFSLQHSDDKLIVKWLKNNGVTPKDYILASLKTNRYIPANLDMAQNHFFSSFFFSYSHNDGFTKQSLDSYIKWINNNNPKFIIWDVDFQDEEYSQVINKISGERKIDFNFDEFNSRISENYQIADTITKRIIVYTAAKLTGR